MSTHTFLKSEKNELFNEPIANYGCYLKKGKFGLYLKNRVCHDFLDIFF